MPTQFSVKQLKSGIPVQARFGIKRLEERTTKNGKPYWRLELTHPTGSIAGIVWQDAMAMVQVLEGGVADIEAAAQEYQGRISLTVHKATPVTETQMIELLPQVKTVLIDPVYVGTKLTALNSALVEGMQTTAGVSTPDELSSVAFNYPPLAKLVLVGLINPHSHKGMILGVTEKKLAVEAGDIGFEACADEAALIRRLWELLHGYEQVISMGGRRKTTSALCFRTLANQLTVPFNLDRKLLDLSTMVRAYDTSRYPLEVLSLSFGVGSDKEIVSDATIRELADKKLSIKTIEAQQQRLQLMSQLYGFYREKAGVLL